MDIEGKGAIVTGGASGRSIGRSRFAMQPAQWVCARSLECPVPPRVRQAGESRRRSAQSTLGMPAAFRMRV